MNEEAWRFALAGCSCMTAAAVTNPIDVIKIRMQIDNELSKGKAAHKIFSERNYKGIVRGSVKIIQDEGVAGLYKGQIVGLNCRLLSQTTGSSTAPSEVFISGINFLHTQSKMLVASLMREGIYSTIRLGAYEPLKRLLGATDPANTPLWKKICAGAISGAVGSAIATPTDLVKVRQQAQRPGESKRYGSTFKAFAIIYAKEGIKGLYVGITPTVQRATILTATQIPAYDHVKHTILNYELMQEGVRLHVTSSMIAGFITALTTSPVDVIKTRVMNQKGKSIYKNSWDCFVKTLKSEGPLGLYKGFIPNWMRIGPHTLVTFFVFEQLRKLIGMAPV